ncbi:MAG: hypothetical protein KDJ29_08285 [Hyphomicrobiales bacterium]|nr:hypothetical protein [Nitratireductor sp.]MCC2096876.1 hypothetical protein [Hyphomicrobiales bacterium]
MTRKHDLPFELHDRTQEVEHQVAGRVWVSKFISSASDKASLSDSFSGMPHKRSAMERARMPIMRHAHGQNQMDKALENNSMV